MSCGATINTEVTGDDQRPSACTKVSPIQRQDRGIRNLEQKKTNGKGKKATIFKEYGAADPLRMRGMLIGSTTRAAEVNVASAYPDKRQNHRDAECGGYVKDICRGQQVANNTHDSGCRKATD